MGEGPWSVQMNLALESFRRQASAEAPWHEIHEVEALGAQCWKRSDQILSGCD